MDAPQNCGKMEIIMIRIKQNGVRAVIQPQSGVVTLCDTLTFAMLDALNPTGSQEISLNDLPDEFPMGLRYSFAKYDSTDLKRAYAAIKEIYRLNDDRPLLPAVRTAALIQSDDLPDFNTVQTWADHCAESFVCTVDALSGNTNAAQLTNFLRMIHEKFPKIQLHLRCREDFAFENLPVQRVYLHAGESDTITGNVPYSKNVFLCAVCTKDYVTEALRLYHLGYKKLSLLPAPTANTEAFLTVADKLAREWIRIKRNDPEAVFLPFTFADVHPGIWQTVSAPLSTDTLPGYFYNAGLLSHIAPDVSDTALLAKCVECAVVLQAQCGLQS